jgi:hypothetical protein
VHHGVVDAVVRVVDDDCTRSPNRSARRRSNDVDGAGVGGSVVVVANSVVVVANSVVVVASVVDGSMVVVDDVVERGAAVVAVVEVDGNAVAGLVEDVVELEPAQADAINATTAPATRTPRFDIQSPPGVG